MNELEQFRQQTRDWLEANCPASMRIKPTEKDNVYGGRKWQWQNSDARVWLERMAGKGWTVPDWPQEYGGAGLTAQQSKVLYQEMQRLGCRKPLIGHGIMMLGPALLEHGSEQQKCEHLPKIASGEIRWCQGYSEPGAGSDLASLRCKAEDQGDHYLVNGQKCWTTDADKADWMFCLVRTRDDGKKQEGISFVLFDMETPGVSTRPVPLITGVSHFCDTFLDNVVVPKKNLVGELNRGWTIAKALLVHERKHMADLESSMPLPQYTVVEYAQQFLSTDKRGRVVNSLMRERIVEHLMRKQAIELSERRAYEEGVAGTLDMRMINIFKYIGTEEQKEKANLIVDILGLTGGQWEQEHAGHSDAQNSCADIKRATTEWMSSMAYTIAGGSSEVQLNLIAKRSLALPEE